MKLKKVSAGHYEADGGRVVVTRRKRDGSLFWVASVYGQFQTQWFDFSNARAWVEKLEIPNTEGSA